MTRPHTIESAEPRSEFADMWPIARVARYLNMSEPSVLRTIHEGRLPAFRVGRFYRCRPADVDALIVAVAPTDLPDTDDDQ